VNYAMMHGSVNIKSNTKLINFDQVVKYYSVSSLMLMMLTSSCLSETAVMTRLHSYISCI
jgi:hypothetical protein